MLFEVPALPLRYGLGFGAAAASITAGGAVVAAAVWRGWDRGVAGRLALVAGAGAIAAAAGIAVTRGVLLEARLLVAAAGAVLAGGGACLALDRPLAL